jgi:DNA-binding NtrC family response regulator
MPQTKTATLQRPPNAVDKSALVPQLFCVLERGCPLGPASRHAIDGVDEIRLGRSLASHEERFHLDEKARLTIRISDRWLSTDHAVITRDGDRYVFCDRDSKNGSQINGVAVKSHTLQDGDIISVGQSFLVFRARCPLPETEPRNFVISPDQVVPYGLGTLNATLSRRFSDLGQISQGEQTVAILGEPGTGKELVARAVHDMSKRRGAFIPVNCGALPSDLAAGELFGHVKGAFTGAIADRPGLIRSADRGTLFLDELGELPLEQQVVLLRVLQDHHVTPIGGSPHHVDFRLVVATNRDMNAALASRQFRDDLWSRVHVNEIHLPPLRDRREDLGLILGSMLLRLRGRDAPAITIHSDASYALLRHDWPGNIRELEHCMQTAMALCQGDTINFANLPESIRTPPANRRPEPAAEDDTLEERAPVDPEPDADDDLIGDEDPAGALDQLRQEQLHRLLEREGGNVSEVARIMGKRRSQIQRWIKRYGIDLKRYRRR